VCQSLKFLVASICDPPDVINCQFCEREFAAALLGPVAGQIVWNSLPDHLHEPAVDSDQFRRERRICSPDIWNVSTLEVLHNRTLQIDIYLLTYCRLCLSVCMACIVTKWKKPVPTFSYHMKIIHPSFLTRIPEILDQTDPVRAKTLIFNPHSLVAPKP